MNEVPLIDLTPALHGGRAERLAVAARIDEACREIGFFAIGGHGVPARMVDDLRSSAHAFFGLPLADKVAVRHPVAGTNRGYHPVGGEALSKANDAAAPPDLKEFFHVGPVGVSDDAYYTSALGRQHFIPNIWPAIPPGFATAATTYYRAMDQLIVFLMRLAALALRVDEAFFDDKVDRSIGTMRLNYYPAQAVAPAPGQLRASAHTDYGGFTILAGEDVPGGLQVLTRAGQLVDLGGVAPHIVALEHRYDLVVRLAAIDDLQSPDDGRAQQHLAVRDGALADDADIQGVTVAALASGSQAPHPLAAVGLRDEAVQRRRLRGGALRAVHAQVAGGLVDLVLHEVKRGDLDIGVHDARRILTRLQAMPGVGAPARIGARVGHAPIVAPPCYPYDALTRGPAFDARRDYRLG